MPVWTYILARAQRTRRTTAAHMLSDAGVSRVFRGDGTPRLLLALGAWVAATLAASRALAAAQAVMVKVHGRPTGGDAVAGAAWDAEEYMARRALNLVSAVVEQVSFSWQGKGMVRV